MTSVTLARTLEQAAIDNPQLAGRIRRAAQLLARHAADRSARIITARLTAAGAVYSVAGSRGARYDVTLTPRVSCTCPDRVNRDTTCYHILACRGLELAMGAPEKAPTPSASSAALRTTPVEWSPAGGWSHERRVRADWSEEV